MKLINVDNLTKFELQKRCKKGLNMSRKDSKVNLQIALFAYKEVKRLQAVTEEDDLEGDLGPDEKEIPEENLELQKEHPCPQEENQNARDGAEQRILQRPVTSGVGGQEEGRKLKLELDLTRLRLINVYNLTKFELQKRCKKGLNMSRKDSKVNLQIALFAYKEVKRLQAVTEEDDLEGDFGPDEK
ncbi:hypothetical protein NDU88_008266 [Pleurodeles waltl]|uniref:Uncharacterized protein n=1 Tax=Pleurodeles waltl TaxID=8319 RepID=A0AAV7RV99_PLEWA|nr:hypothetical protein NDU88_008266 [Pleurodeles waltl]